MIGKHAKLSDENLTFKNVDFSLCSRDLLFKFVDMMQDEYNLGHAGRIGYLDALVELGDFRKVNGALVSVLRGLSCTELYLKKVRKTVSKMMRLQWTSELDIDALEAKGHWATLEELLEVVGRYLPRYESVLKSCKDNPGSISPFDLSFATTGGPDVVFDYKTMYENTLKIALNSTCMKDLNKNVLPYVYLALF